MRVLILSANTGGGHNSTARAVAEQLEKLNIECEIADTLAFISEKVSDFISWGHSYVYRKMPRLFGFGYRYEEKHPPRFIYEQCAKGVDSLYQKLQQDSFDAVVCVHVFSGMMMTEVRRRYGSTLPAFFIATDYTCSPGVSELAMDAYFIPHRMLLGEFVRSGVSADKLYATGIPVCGDFYQECSKPEVRQALSLPVDGNVVLLSCGSMGCGKLEKSAMMLFRQLSIDTTLVVLCGRNEKTYEMLAPFESSRFRVLHFTDAVAMYMSAADIYITKPGGLSTTEAIARRLPMLLIDAVPGLETRNFDFLIQNGVAMGAKNWRQAGQTVAKALNHPDMVLGQIEAMKTFHPSSAAEQICKHIVSSIQQ